jgi:hypothetical protein
MPESPSELGQIQSIRRSVTLPTKLNPLAQRRSSVPNTPEHVIFYHPSAKIVHFAPRALAPIPSSSAPSDFDYPVDTIETLPWRSATERTVATAPLRLEKVQGSTAFLKCGNVVHAILKNSQCWCVDGVSKFVLRIRPLTYYRIEIPHESEDDRGLVQDFKIALPTVLRYEVTPCPFKRAFSVELPSDAMAPRRKKAWQPKDRRESIPVVLESPLESSSLFSTRSECIDSASTGDDTDGNLTDDSCFTSHKTNGNILETSPNNRESTSAELPRPSSSHGFPSRLVSETPQPVSSLLAKFQATLAPEDDCHSGLEHRPEDITRMESVPPVDLEAKSVVKNDMPEPQSEGETQTLLELEITVKAESTAELDPKIENKLELGVASSAGPTSEADLQVESAIPVQAERALEVEGLDDAEPSITIESQEAREAKVGSDDHIHFATEQNFEVDDDASFSSSPESFHSVEPQSPDSVSTYPTSVGGHDLPEPTDMFNLPSAKELISGMESTPNSWCNSPQLPISDSSTQTADVSTNIVVPADRSASHLSPDALPRRFPDTLSNDSLSMALTSQACQPSPNTDAFQEIKMVTRPAVKASALNTDFNHMSTEFRRRAKATREREVSPMPHSSALYQPSPNDDAKSFISKAIMLVLIPPAYLFVVLLHIAARVVINPPTTQSSIRSTPKASNSNPKQISEGPATEDDFSFPLEPQTSSEYEDAEIFKKLDPWDLD